MPVRTGTEYIEALDERAIQVEIEGRALHRGASPRSRSSGTSCGRTRQLFDLQHDPALRDVMTYESPTTGERVGMSFLQPQSVDDVESARRGDAGLGRVLARQPRSHGRLLQQRA